MQRWINVHTSATTDMIIDALTRVINDYEFATERHQDPLQSSDTNQRTIRRCHPQLELLISFVREMEMSEKQRLRVKKILEYVNIIIDGQRLCDFATRL